MTVEAHLLTALPVLPQIPCLSKSLCDLLRDLKIDRQRPSKNPQARSPRIEKIDERSRSESKQNYSNRARSPSTQRTIGGSPSWSLRNSYSLLVDIEESQASSGIAFPEPEVPRDSDLRTPDQWEIPEQILQKHATFNNTIVSHLTWPHMDIDRGFQMLMAADKTNILNENSETCASIRYLDRWNTFSLREHERGRARDLLRLSRESDNAGAGLQSSNPESQDVVETFHNLLAAKTESVLSRLTTPVRAMTGHKRVLPLLDRRHYEATHPSCHSLKTTGPQGRHIYEKSWKVNAACYPDAKSSFFKNNATYLSRSAANDSACKFDKGFDFADNYCGNDFSPARSIPSADHSIKEQGVPLHDMKASQKMPDCRLHWAPVLTWTTLTAYNSSLVSDLIGETPTSLHQTDMSDIEPRKTIKEKVGAKEDYKSAQLIINRKAHRLPCEAQAVISAFRLPLVPVHNFVQLTTNYPNNDMAYNLPRRAILADFITV